VRPKTIVLAIEERLENPIVNARQTYFKDIAVIAVPEGIPKKDDLVILTGQMKENGVLDWKAPAGNWTIYRFGHTTTEAMIQPAEWDGMGWAWNATR